MTWDTVQNLKELLDQYSETTGSAYVLLVTQGNEETPRVIVKAAAAVPHDCAGPNVFEALESAASDLFDEMAAQMGIEPDDPDDPVA